MARRKKRTGRYGLRLFKRPIFIKKLIEKDKKAYDKKENKEFGNEPPY